MDPKREAEPPRTIGFGTYVNDDDWASFRDRLRQAIARLHEARPGVKCLVYYDTQRDISTPTSAIPTAP